MKSFISGPVLQVNLEAISTTTNMSHLIDRPIDRKISNWKILKVFNIDSNDDQNMHLSLEGMFPIILILPEWVDGLDSQNLSNYSDIILERVFDQTTGTESWRVL